jgi:hypothetical protein
VQEEEETLAHENGFKKFEIPKQDCMTHRAVTALCHDFTALCHDFTALCHDFTVLLKIYCHDRVMTVCHDRVMTKFPNLETNPL